MYQHVFTRKWTYFPCSYQSNSNMWNLSQWLRDLNLFIVRVCFLNPKITRETRSTIANFPRVVQHSSKPHACSCGPPGARGAWLLWRMQNTLGSSHFKIFQILYSNVGREGQVFFMQGDLTNSFLIKKGHRLELLRHSRQTIN